MKKQWIIACLIGIQGVNVQAQQPSKYPYQDTKLTAEQRADDLLQRLTLEEKVALMQNNSPAIPRLGIKPYEWNNAMKETVTPNCRMRCSGCGVKKFGGGVCYEN